MIDNNCESLWHLAITHLKRANVDRKHPFRLCLFSTLHIHPQSRWVVKRAIDTDLNIIIYTDNRTPKVKEISDDPHTSFTFYHPKNKLQVRVETMSEVVLAGEVYEHHYAIAKQNPKDYISQTIPGFPLIEAFSYSDDMHFAVIKSKPVKWDILQLGGEEHKRAQYILKDGIWKGTWVTP